MGLLHVTCCYKGWGLGREHGEETGHNLTVESIYVLVRSDSGTITTTCISVQAGELAS